MTLPDTITKLADEFELPVEQVMLIVQTINSVNSYLDFDDEPLERDYREILSMMFPDVDG